MADDYKALIITSIVIIIISISSITINETKLAIIYKKGGTDLRQNYRPIALLNVMYKLLASIIQARISSKMDEVIDKNKFGFRKRKKHFETSVHIKKIARNSRRGSTREPSTATGLGESIRQSLTK